MTESKICTLCKVELNIKKFYFDKSNNAYIAKCKSCRSRQISIYQKKRRVKENPDMYWNCANCNHYNHLGKMRCFICDQRKSI